MEMVDHDAPKVSRMLALPLRKRYVVEAAPGAEAPFDANEVPVPPPLEEFAAGKEGCTIL